MTTAGEATANVDHKTTDRANCANSEVRWRTLAYRVRLLDVCEVIVYMYIYSCVYIVYVNVYDRYVCVHVLWTVFAERH